MDYQAGPNTVISVLINEKGRRKLAEDMMVDAGQNGAMRALKGL